MDSIQRKRAIIVIAASAIVLALMVFGREVSPAWSPHDRNAHPGEYGRALLAAGDYRRAAETLRAAYRAAPSEELRIEFARALLATGDFAGVLEILEAADARNASARDSRILRAEAMIRSRRYAEADAVAVNLLVEQGADGRAMLIAARARYGRGDVSAAREWLSKSLRADGEAQADSWLFRARMALDANDLRAARAAISRAKESSAGMRLVAHLDAEARMREGDFKGALAALDSVAQTKRVRTRRVDPQREYIVARIAAAAGDYRSAARRLRAIKGALAGDADVGLLAGLIYERVGDVAQAEAEFRKGLAAAPEDAAQLDALAALMIRTRRFDEARTIVDRLRVAAPGAGAARDVQILLQEDDHDAIVAAAKRAASDAPAGFATAFAFGPASDAAKRDAAELRVSVALVAGAKALMSADANQIGSAARELEGMKEQPSALMLAGELALALDEPQRARVLFEHARHAAPASAGAVVGLLRTYIRDGDLAGAEAWLSDVVSRDAGNASARSALARVLRVQGRRAAAAALLRPVSVEIVASKSDAALYAHLLKSTGATTELGAFADLVRRARPDDPTTVTHLVEAGRLEPAARVARDALLAAPGDQERAEIYTALMGRIDRAGEAAAFLRALADRPRDPARLDAASEIGTEITLREAMAAYLASPTDVETASRFGMALAEAEDPDLGTRIFREACFWGLEENCLPPAPPHGPPAPRKNGVSGI